VISSRSRKRPLHRSARTVVAFGDLHAAASARGGLHAHDAARGRRSHYVCSRRKLHLGAREACRPENTEGYSAAAHIVRESRDARGPGGVPRTSTACGASRHRRCLRTARTRPASRSMVARTRGRTVARKPSRAGGIVSRLDAARRLDVEGARRG
jgi:hypothetical protein